MANTRGRPKKREVGVMIQFRLASAPELRPSTVSSRLPVVFASADDGAEEVVDQESAPVWSSDERILDLKSAFERLSEADRTLITSWVAAGSAKKAQQALADTYGVHRSTMYRRVRGLLDALWSQLEPDAELLTDARDLDSTLNEEMSQRAVA